AAGMLYFHVHNAMISENKLFQETALEHEIFEKYKMQGLLLADEGVVKLMDETLDSGYSNIVPVAVTKKGGVYETAVVISAESVEGLEADARKLMTAARLKMTSGNISLNPYEYDDMTPCQFCYYRSVCQSDESLTEDEFRLLSKMDDEEVIDKI